MNQCVSMSRGDMLRKINSLSCFVQFKIGLLQSDIERSELDEEKIYELICMRKEMLDKLRSESSFHADIG